MSNILDWLITIFTPPPPKKKIHRNPLFLSTANDTKRVIPTFTSPKHTVTSIDQNKSDNSNVLCVVPLPHAIPSYRTLHWYQFSYCNEYLIQNTFKELKAHQNCQIYRMNETEKWLNDKAMPFSHLSRPSSWLKSMAKIHPVIFFHFTSDVLASLHSYSLNSCS